MSEPSFVVLPVSGSGPNLNRETAEIASTVQQALYERSHPEPEHPGPFKQILAHPDSLYKYINWEDPIRTLSLYLGATSILFGAHYLPLTQMALKAGVTTLGVVSVTEFASRSFSGNSLSIRLRPKEYKKIPEPALNATLKDIHDLIQYAVVQAQRIFFGQDLDKTFAAFLGFFALFWLTKLVSSFWFTFIALTSIFVAPLVSSEQGRRAAHDASVRAQELANVAAEKGREIGHDGKAKATELSSKGKQTVADLSAQARDTASDMSNKVSELSYKGKQTTADLSAQTRATASDMSDKASELSSRGKQTTADLSAQTRATASDMSDKASELSSRGKQTTADLSAHTRATASDMSDKASELSSRGKQTTADLSAHTRATASDMSGTATENIKKMPQMGKSAVNETEDIASSTYGNAKGYISNPSAPHSNHTNGHSDGNRFVSNGASTEVPHLSNGANETTKRMSSGVNTGKQPDSNHRQYPVSFLPAQTGGVRTGVVTDTGLKYTGAGHAATAHDMASRPRGAHQPTLDRA